jgi:hypothetical protein
MRSKTVFFLLMVVIFSLSAKESIALRPVAAASRDISFDGFYPLYASGESSTTAIKLIVINGKLVSARDARKAISVVEHAPHIFNVFIEHGAIYIDISPTRDLAQRIVHHADLTHVRLRQGVISGILSPGRPILLLDQSINFNMNTSEILFERDEYILLARFLIENGISAKTPYNSMAAGDMVSMGIFEVKLKTLFALARLSTSSERAMRRAFDKEKTLFQDSYCVNDYKSLNHIKSSA